MWLDDYYQREYKPEWDQKPNKEVMVYIPISQVLNPSAVEAIQQQALRFHRIQHLLQEADIATKQDPNYGFMFKSEGNQTSIGVYPKHPQATEVHPIELIAEFNEDENKLLQQAKELGVPVDIESKVELRGLPHWLTEYADKDAPAMLRLFPLVPDVKSHLQFEYFNEHGESLYKSKVVDMMLVQAGTKYQRFEGKAAKEPIGFAVVFDAIAPSTSLNITFDFDNRSVTSINAYLELIDRLQETKSVVVYNLDIDQQHTLIDYEAFESDLEISEVMSI